MNPKRIVIDNNFTGELKNQFVGSLKRHLISVYMPPSVYRAIKPDDNPKELLSFIKIKSPSRYELEINPFFFFDFVGQLRVRMNKALRSSSRIISNSREKSGREALGILRNTYRSTMRDGMLNSQEELDLIFLSMELDAHLVSENETLMDWARTFGVKIISPEDLMKVLD